MKSMFESATLKLTAWYLLILMSISLLFSVVIFQISTAELQSRLTGFATHFEIERQPEDYQGQLLERSQLNLFFALFYTNLAILLLGGIASYFAARKSLEPIEKSHEAQSRFTSDASHELRTPLAVMKSELEVALRDSKLSKADMRELLESNLEEVNRLSDLSQTLLQLSRHELDKIDMKQLMMHDIVAKVVKIHGLPKKRLQFESTSKKLAVLGNSSSLTELVMILVDNALRYSPGESTVHISLSAKDDQVVLTITNKGQGIAADDLPHVFERFWRADKARTAAGGSSGFGLGLSLAKNISDLHDGKLSITSEPNKLTTVIFALKRL